MLPMVDCHFCFAQGERKKTRRDDSCRDIGDERRFDKQVDFGGVACSTLILVCGVLLNATVTLPRSLRWGAA
jgi:hypothetical protein